MNSTCDGKFLVKWHEDRYKVHAYSIRHSPSEMYCVRESKDARTAELEAWRGIAYQLAERVERSLQA